MHSMAAETESVITSRAKKNGETAKQGKGIDQKPVDEFLYLIGRPTLKQYLRFVRSHAFDPPHEGVLTKEWNDANSVLSKLEKEEAGIADNPPIVKMDVRKYEPLLVNLLKDPLIKNGFNTVPTEIAFVDLDRMVVYQKHIDLTFARQLEMQLHGDMTEEKIFQTCLPYDHPQPPIKWSRIHRDTFVFISPSNDLRFLGTMPLKPENVKDYPPPGNFVGVAGVAIGFGSNFLNAVFVENRLILNNGSHRAYALRKMGYRHVPCIIQHVSSREELDIVAASEVTDNPDFFLKHPRPSMLKDYFNSALHKVMPVHRKLRQVTVKFEVDEASIPTL